MSSAPVYYDYQLRYDHDLGEHGKAHRGSSKLWNISAWGMREWYVLTYIFGAVFALSSVMTPLTGMNSGNRSRWAWAPLMSGLRL